MKSEPITKELIKTNQESIVANKLNQMKNGERVVMSDQHLDLLFAMDDPMVNHVASIPNPNQVGTLDRWVAYIKP